MLIIEFPVVNVLSGGQWHLLLFVAGQPTLGYATVCLYFGKTNDPVSICKTFLNLCHA